MNLADRVQHLRKVKGISQEELADQIGVSRQAVSKWESEQSIPNYCFTNFRVSLYSDLFRDNDCANKKRATKIIIQ
jgi:Predicted transcriptional regulators